MRFPTFFKSLTSTSTRRRPTRRRSPASRLYLEVLEDRHLLSTFSVLNFLDSGPGSLREAITNANGAPGADLISFAPAARDGTIALTGGQLSITDDLTIDGPGAGRLAVSGNDASRVFQISSGVAVSIDDLTVTHGRAVGRGGGILNAGTMTLSRAILSDNLVVGLPARPPAPSWTPSAVASSTRGPSPSAPVASSTTSALARTALQTASAAPHSAEPSCPLGPQARRLPLPSVPARSSTTR